MCGKLVYDYSYLQGMSEDYLQPFEIRIDMFLENTNKSVFECIARSILSSGNNRVLTFTVVAIQTSIGYACTTVNLNGTARTVRYPGSVVSTASTTSYDIFNFTGINTNGSASTTANYQVLGIVNGNFK